MKSYRDLTVWQKAMDLAVRVYDLTANFPSTERFGLAQQMKNAALSVPSNIAEGYGRRSLKHRLVFLDHALGSLFEIETQIELATRVHLIRDDAFDELNERTRQIGRGLTALMKYVESEAADQKTPRPRSASPSEELRGTPRNPRN